MSLAAPQYANATGYCRNGIYLGFTAIGNLHTAITTLEQHLSATQGVTNYLEVISLGLPNGSGGHLGSATSTIAATANCPQSFVWAGPLVPMDGSVSLTSMAAGALDSDLIAIGASFVTAVGGGAARPGIQGEHTIRMGWEFDYSNYPWGLGVTTQGHKNTNADIAAAMDHYIVKVLAGGYTGNFTLNCGVDVTAVYPLMTQQAHLTSLDIDAYNTTGTFDLHNWETIWTATRHTILNNHAAFCRANGKKMGMPECGVEIIRTDQNGYHFHSGPTGTFWSYMHQFAVDNADIMLYMTPFNQELPASGNPTTADDQLFFYGNPAGTVPLVGNNLDQVNLGSLRNNNSTAGFWVDTPSPYKALELADYKTNMIAGSMQVPDTTGPPPITVGSTNARRKVNNFTSVFA